MILGYIMMDYYLLSREVFVKNKPFIRLPIKFIPLFLTFKKRITFPEKIKPFYQIT
jgi:hypothetical protein